MYYTIFKSSGIKHCKPSNFNTTSLILGIENDPHFSYFSGL